MKKIILFPLLIWVAMTDLSAIPWDSSLIQVSREVLKNDGKAPILYMPIGPSGSGKSTLYKKIQAEAPEIKSFSFDVLRHTWYDLNDYDLAYKASVADPAFFPRAQAIFCKMLLSSSDIYLDATSLNPSRRHFFIKNAKERGYLIVGFLFSTKLETLIARQATRVDKCLVEEEVRKQYLLLKSPEANEGFDLVFFLDDNSDILPSN